MVEGLPSTVYNHSRQATYTSQAAALVFDLYLPYVHGTPYSYRSYGTGHDTSLGDASQVVGIHLHPDCRLLSPVTDAELRGDAAERLGEHYASSAVQYAHGLYRLGAYGHRSGEVVFPKVSEAHIEMVAHSIASHIIEAFECYFVLKHSAKVGICQAIVVLIIIAL